MENRLIRAGKMPTKEAGALKCIVREDITRLYLSGVGDSHEPVISHNGKKETPSQCQEGSDGELHKTGAVGDGEVLQRVGHNQGYSTTGKRGDPGETGCRGKTSECGAEN